MKNRLIRFPIETFEKKNTTFNRLKSVYKRAKGDGNTNKLTQHNKFYDE